MWSISLPVVAIIIGLLMWFQFKDGKWQEFGKMMVFAGLLAFLLSGGAAVTAFFATHH